MSSDAVVEISGLTVRFLTGGAPIDAVNGVDLSVRRGEVVALIGESGSGKSVTLRSVLALHAPSRTRIGGAIRVAGRDVLTMGRRELADLRGSTVAMILSHSSDLEPPPTAVTRFTSVPASFRASSESRNAKATASSAAWVRVL